MNVTLDDLYCIIITEYNGNQTTDICYDMYKKHKHKHYTYIECKIKDTPHYLYVSSNKKDPDYKKYAIMTGAYAGFGLEHSVLTYNKLIDTFVENTSLQLRCKRKKNKIILLDGVHRTSILLSKYGANHHVRTYF
jgi:hypothetical protein